MLQAKKRHVKKMVATHWERNVTLGETASCVHKVRVEHCTGNAEVMGSNPVQT